MQKRDILIRAATKEDLPRLLEFEQGVVAAERPFAINFKQSRITYYDLDTLLDADDAQLVVAEGDGELLGCGYVIIKESEPHYKASQFGYLGFMYVVPQWRGQGLNQQIMQTLMDWGHSQGIDVFKLDVFEANASAVRAYEKAGFKSHLLEMVLER